MRRHRFYFLLLFALISLISDLSSAFGCPSICTCKWKYGKETVECVNKGVATLPDGIELRTQVLDFSGNNLQSLRRHAFLSRNLINLQRIHLKNCKLGEIDDDALAQLTNLVEFDLSSNLLTSIPYKAFRHIPALRVLNLAGNLISSVPKQSFVNNNGLVNLDLSLGRIKHVDPNSFDSLTLLEKLHIQGNKLRELPERVIHNLRNVHELRVHHNPWFCDCRALPLWRILEERRISHPISPICKAPNRIRERRFETLQEDDFACPPEIHPIYGVVHGVAGENATLTCRVEGQPSPDVEWYIEDKHVQNGSVLGIGPQRVYIVNNKKTSNLVITGAQEGDSGQVRCIAVNPAGQAEANFTLAVTMRSISSDVLSSGHIAGISVSLVVLALIIFVVAFLLFARSRSSSSPTPVKVNNPTCSIVSTPSEPNPIQKPPRLTNLSSSNSTDPDIISEAEKSRGTFVNGHIPNGHSGKGLMDARYEDGALFQSSMWESKDKILHEHYNPGYLVQESPSRMGPSHSTPYKVVPDPNFDPQIYGYPPDYGLPIPETVDDIYYDSKHETLSTTLTADDSTEPYLRSVVVGSQQTLPADSREELYQKSISAALSDTSEMRIHENMIAEDASMNLSPRLKLAEGSASPQLSGPPAERPWVPGSQAAPPAVPMGVPVLPPLPGNAVSRIKARDSPDEGYQEGTEV